MKIIVTGGAGMIGSNLVSSLLNKGHDVHVIDNFWRGSLDNLIMTCGDNYQQLNVHVADMSVFGEWVNILKDADCVYHLADIVAGIGYVFGNEGLIFRKNLQINSNITSACEMMEVKRYVYVGTACSFPLELQTGVSSKPLEEVQQFPANPESAYGWSKLMGELDAKYLTESSGIPSVVLVFHNVYGTPTEYKSDRAQAIPAMCYRALKADNGNKILSVWGDGSQGRAFVHVSDVVHALELALSKGENSGAIQIGPDICTSISTIANHIIAEVNPEIEVKYDTTKPIGDKGRSANYSKAKSILGWEPKIDIKYGISELVKWIRKKEC